MERLKTGTFSGLEFLPVTHENAVQTIKRRKIEQWTASFSPLP